MANISKIKMLDGTKYEVKDSNARTRLDTIESKESSWDAKSNFSGNYNDLTNKPSIPVNTGDLNNNSGFITKAVADLTNYYKKTETYTQEEVNGLISAIPKFSILPVNSLPTENISTTTIYLVKDFDLAGNLYTEYIYVNGAWEKLGVQSVDLSNYRTSAAQDAIDKEKVDKVTGKGLSTEDYTTAEKNKLSGIEAGANNYVHPGSGTNPHGTTKSDVGLGNVGNFKAVSTVASQGLTDTEKSNARSNIGAGTSSFSGNYNDLTNKPTIPSAVTESTVSGWGFTKNTGTYSKPSTGIPKTDLASAVQTSLGKADSALQSHQDISGKQDKSTAVTHTANTAVGSATQPVYINSNGVATKTTYSLGKSVPSDAKFTDTWRGIQDNLTSTSTTESLSANQGKILDEKISKVSGTISELKPTGTPVVGKAGIVKEVRPDGTYTMEWGDAGGSGNTFVYNSSKKALEITCSNSSISYDDSKYALVING